MSHPVVENKTPFVIEPLFLADEDGRPLVVFVVKATYRIRGGARLSLAEEQTPINIEGEYWGNPEESSYKYEPETAFVKMATDIVLIGHAYASQPGVTAVNVSL